MFGILTTMSYLYDIGEGKSAYVSEFIGLKSFEKRYLTQNNKINDFSQAIDFISNKDKSFYTISKYPIDYDNVSLIKKHRSKTSYYSITPHYYSDMNFDLQNAQASVSKGLSEIDYRTKINTLLGTKYYIKKGNNNCVPYGYSKIEEYDGESNIYVNNYALPFGVLYTNYITQAEYDNMSSLEKESSLLKTTVLSEDNNTSLKHNTAVVNTIRTDTIKEVNYEVIDENNLMNDNKVYITDLNKNKLKLKINNITNSEIYLSINNIHFEPQTKQEKIEKELPEKYSRAELKKAQEKYKWYDANYEYKIIASFNKKTANKRVRNYKVSPYYVENNEMLVNLGYYDEASGDIVLDFENLGTYSLSEIKIYAVSMNDYEEDINMLKKSNFEVTEYKNGYLKGKANTETDGVLQFSTMYNKGWKVYVDGKEASTIVSNKYFLGINITKGEHKIEMKYTTPYLKEGIAISVIGIVILVVLGFTKRLLKKSEE